MLITQRDGDDNGERDLSGGVGAVIALVLHVDLGSAGQGCSAVASATAAVAPLGVVVT